MADWGVREDRVTIPLVGGWYKKSGCHWSGTLTHGYGGYGLFQVAHLDEVLGNLNGVEGGALLDLVAYNPEGESVVVAQVLADAAYIDGVLAGQEERHGVLLFGGVVHQHQAFTLGEGFAGLFYADGALGLYPDAL